MKAVALGTCAFCGSNLAQKEAVVQRKIRAYCDDVCRKSDETDLTWRIQKEMPTE